MGRRTRGYIAEGPVTRNVARDGNAQTAGLALFEVILRDEERRPERERRPFASSSLDARPSTVAGSQQGARVLAALLAAGRAGRTRNELAEETGMLVASVCGRVDALLALGLVFEKDDHGQPVRRERCKVLVHATVHDGER